MTLLVPRPRVSNVVEAINSLKSIIKPRRLLSFSTILSSRNVDTVAVFENLNDYGNLAAAIRTAESFGIQNIHVIESWSTINDHLFKESGINRNSVRTSAGAKKWVTIQSHPTVKNCYDHLHSTGHLVLATSLDRNSLNVYGEAQQFIEENGTRYSRPLHSENSYVNYPNNLRPRVALVFGNESRGVSPAAARHADARIYIPMLGFTQSFNVSVAASISLHLMQSRTPDFYVRSLAMQGLRSRLLISQHFAPSEEYAFTTPPGPDPNMRDSTFGNSSFYSLPVDIYSKLLSGLLDDNGHVISNKLDSPEVLNRFLFPEPVDCRPHGYNGPVMEVIDGDLHSQYLLQWMLREAAEKGYKKLKSDGVIIDDY